MTLVDGLVIFFSILLCYFVIVLILHKRGILEKHNISFYGPTLLLRTKKGLGFLKKIASKKRFWKAYGSFGIVFCLVSMFIVVIFFIWNFIILLGITPEQKAALPGPEFILALPGINPILPMEYFFYIILAFIVAIIVHEFSHGILSFASKIKVKSMGLVYIIIPFGAFVEPDEKQLKNTKISKRMRVFAAGPLGNFVVVLICILLISLIFVSSVQPSSGLTVFNVYKDSPFDDAGIKKGAIITQVNEFDLTNNESNAEGVLFYRNIINQTSANDTIMVSYRYNGVFYTKYIDLVDKYTYFQDNYNVLLNNSTKGKGFDGVYNFILVKNNLDILKNPITNLSRFTYFLLIPVMGYFEGFNPIADPFIDSYKIEGPLGALPKPVFWGIINALYWIFWLNLMVGLFNVLPMIPLDGGFLFNDLIRGTVKKIKKDISSDKTDIIVKNVSLVISLIILLLILFPLIIKYI
jgi:membrane-associated protease RseP (regulator of RpoE activity)